MHGQESSSELGKMPFYGYIRNFLGAHDFCSRARGRPRKVSIIRNLTPPTTVKGIRSFLGHAGFYRRFIRDFSKIAKPLYRLLEKDTKFYFDESCQNSFEGIKSRLVEAPIMEKLYWNREFEIMCDASDFAMGAVLEQKAEKVFKAIYYADKTFNEAQENYSTTEKEMVAIVFACKNLGHTFWGSMLLYTLIMQQLSI